MKTLASNVFCIMLYNACLRKNGSSGSLSTIRFSQDANEETPLMKAKRHQQYLKYGSGSFIMKSGSMRTGPSLKTKSPQRVKKPVQSMLPMQVMDKLLGTNEADKSKDGGS